MSTASSRAARALVALVAVLCAACSGTAPAAAPSGSASSGSIAAAAPGSTPGTMPTGTEPAPGTTEPATTPPPTETATTPVPTTTTTLPTTTTTVPCVKIHVVCPPTGGVPTTVFHAPVVTVTETPTDIYNNLCGPKSGGDTRALFSIIVDPGADAVRVSWTIDGKPGFLSATLTTAVGGPNTGMFYNATFDAMQLVPKLAEPSERVDFTVTATNAAGTGTAHTAITLWRCGTAP